MITDADIKKMSKVFATKNDIKALATKKDLSRVETKVSNVDTKVSKLETKMDKSFASLEKRVDELTDFLVPAIGNILEWTDDIHRAIVGKPSKHTHEN